MTEEDKYFRTIDTGGYSPCILGNNEIIPRGEPRNVLPNCVGYAVGRFNEMGSYGYCKYLGNTDAKYFIDLARSQGLEIGMTPKIGACMVWSNGDGEDKHGHVAIVEQILDPYAVLVSESGWDASVYTWSCSHYLGEDGQWLSGNPDEPYTDLGWLNQTNGYRFLGFIYNPALEIDKSIPNPVEEDKTKNQFKINCADTMNIRLDHSLSGEVIGFGKIGYYDTDPINMASQDGYQWYEIEKGKWCALIPPYSEFIGVEENKQETPQNDSKDDDNTNIPKEPKTPENEPKDDKKDNIFMQIIKMIVEILRKLLDKGEKQ